MVLDESIRHELVTLARRSKARVTAFRSARPNDWRPGQVHNPDGLLDSHFTDASAWDYIAAKLESGHLVKVMRLDKPPGAKGYVMKIDIEPEMPQLYVKLQLGSGKIFGRSFHYSDRKDRRTLK